jgi:hypothetical protein
MINLPSYQLSFFNWIFIIGCFIIFINY